MEVKLVMWSNKVICILQFFVILLQNYIYFGHNSDPVIYIYDKSSMVLVNMSWFRLREGGGITDMAMYASDAQPLNTTSKSVTPSLIKLVS